MPENEPLADYSILDRAQEDLMYRDFVLAWLDYKMAERELRELSDSYLDYNSHRQIEMKYLWPAHDRWGRDYHELGEDIHEVERAYTYAQRDAYKIESIFGSISPEDFND